MKKDKKGEEGKTRRTVSASFITGAIALVFLIVGFQTALFLGKVRQNRLLAKELATDTTQTALTINQDTMKVADKRTSETKSVNDQKIKSPSNRINHEPKPKRTVENFRFNPNTATVEELVRLGFSEKQAQSIENYRLKGGKFRRKSDFAKSFVVADSVYRRLEPYIDIPLLDLNLADSAAFTTLPGIGGYFAAKMVEYRDQLGGYSYKEQLMDIYRFDSDKFAGLEDLICIDPSYTKPYPLWTLPEDSLSLHPYIGTYAAHGIVVFREHNPREDWTVENLDKAGILREGMGDKLVKCRLE